MEDEEDAFNNAVTQTPTIHGGQDDQVDIIEDSPEEEDVDDLALSQRQRAGSSGGAYVVKSVEMPMLAVGGGAGAAWDDRELIDAWEVAREEFELHNPGPGSWLDKQTAALAIGTPLNGAKETSIASKWYTTSNTAKTANEDASWLEDPAEGSSRSSKSKSKKAKGKKAKGSNPFIPSILAPDHGEERAGSSSYGRSVDPTTNTLESLLGPAPNAAAVQSLPQGSAQSNPYGLRGHAGDKRGRDAGEYEAESRNGGRHDENQQGNMGSDRRPSKRNRVAFASDNNQRYSPSRPQHSYPDTHRALSPAYQPPSPSSYANGAENNQGAGNDQDQRSAQEYFQIDDSSGYGQQRNGRANYGANVAHVEAPREQSSVSGMAGMSSYSSGRHGPPGYGEASLNNASIHLPDLSEQPDRSRSSSAQLPNQGYAPNTTGIYPEMGGQPVTRAFSSGSSMTKEEASIRAVNAQWWSGYWHAMTEVLPSAAEFGPPGG